MKIIESFRAHGRPIGEYESIGAAALPLARGSGEAHAYAVRFAPCGGIGEHEAGFDQLFLVVEGSGWVSGGVAVQVELSAGQCAYFTRGEMHSRGSERGMMALMIQVRDLSLVTAAE